MGSNFNPTGLITNAASGLLGAGMGLMLENHNDNRQAAQQQRLQDIQIKGQKEMTDYNSKKQLDMWNATNIEAQVDHYKNAGMNPGLMYGMGGGGGVTTGSASGSVSGAQAPSGGGEAITAAGMGLQSGMQMQLMEAQKEVLKSQANLNNVEATKKSGIDTTVAISQNEAILQGVDNLRQTHELQKLEITLKNITNYEQQASQSDRLDYIEYQTKSAIKQFNILANNNKISDATVTDNIKRIKAEAIGSILENILTESKTNLTNDTRTLIRKQATQIATNLENSWNTMSNENQKLELQKQLQQWTTDPNREALEQATKIISGIMHAGKQGNKTNIYTEHNY